MILADAIVEQFGSFWMILPIFVEAPVFVAAGLFPVPVFE